MNLLNRLTQFLIFSTRLIAALRGSTPWFTIFMASWVAPDYHIGKTKVFCKFDSFLNCQYFTHWYWALSNFCSFRGGFVQYYILFLQTQLVVDDLTLVNVNASSLILIHLSVGGVQWKTYPLMILLVPPSLVICLMSNNVIHF